MTDFSRNRINDASALTGLANLQVLWLSSNPLNSEFFCRSIAQIEASSPGVDLRYDEPNPNPLTADCLIELRELLVIALHWLEAPCDEANQWCGGSDLLHSGRVNLENLAELHTYWSP